MWCLRLAATTLAVIASAVASSTSRNPLTTLGFVRNCSIHTSNHRVRPFSTFDLSFLLHDQRVRLRLEPNHDILPETATIQHLASDGTIKSTEQIERLDHKVFRGTAWAERQGGLVKAGFARVVIRRDGIDPIFEGVFSIDHDHHHVQMSSNYMRTKHVRDPHLELGDDEDMVVFRDSDIAPHDHLHTELRRDLSAQLACRSDDLGFNAQPDHPIFADVLRRDANFWGVPVGTLFAKRQLDDVQSGNSASVNLISSIGQTAGCPNTRKVALVGVATDCTYTQAFNSTEAARQNIITQINSASDLFERTFNISLGLQNLFVSEPECPSSPPAATPWNEDCSPDVDIQTRLNKFSTWRGGQSDTNSHWTLLTNCNSGSAVGLAWLGQACMSEAQVSNSSGVSETVSGTNVVVRTSTEWQVIAHETGHTFGAVHDCLDSTCRDSNAVNAQQCCPLSSSTCDAGERFIMNPSTSRGITEFSPCSIGNICSAMGRNSVRTSCFSDNRNVPTISGQQCGNGIVEEGEDCDCGGEDGCGDNSCCDPGSCRFRDGAECDDSNEDCCRNCRIASADTVCRAGTGDCDPEERCSGSSSSCPEDVTTPDGDDCGDGLKCASGQCTSRDMQCKTVMGSFTEGNDTYACDDNSCVLSCASPEFGSGVCYGLQQNFLDGTDCGLGGKCQNGVCRGSSFGNEVSSWISENRNLVIGIASAIGGLVLLSILACIWRCCLRRRARPRKRIPTWAAQQPPFQHGRWRSDGSQADNARGSHPYPQGYWQGVPQTQQVYQGPSIRYA